MGEIKDPTPYESWIEAQEIPVHKGYAAEDIPNLPMEHWDRIGCKAAFLHLKGMEGRTAMYAAQLPPGGETRLSQHMYEQIVFIMKGSGRAEVFGPDGKSTSFDWQEGSMFAIPLNARYRITNTGSEPASYVAATTAPLVFDLFRKESFVFGSDLVFDDRYDGSPDFYQRDTRLGTAESPYWEANLIPDAVHCELPSKERRGAGYGSIQFEPVGNGLIGHIAAYPSGGYAKAHHHGGGALLIILRSTGYTLLWPSQAGLHPFEDGRANQVVRVDWTPGTVFSPPTGWFHQHFNTGPETARQIAFRYGSVKYPVGIHKSDGATLRSTNDGGTQIEYPDEDPEIRRLFVRETAARGVAVSMPSVG